MVDLSACLIAYQSALALDLYPAGLEPATLWSEVIFYEASFFQSQDRSPASWKDRVAV